MLIPYNAELRFFLLVVAGSILIITINIYPQYESIGESLNLALFQVSAIISTTGFATADYMLWPTLSQTILILLMFVGACAGSTGGGMKCSRILLLLRCIRREIHRITNPRRVEVIKLDGKVVEENTLYSILLFVGCYIAIILAGTLATQWPTAVLQVLEFMIFEHFGVIPIGLFLFFTERKRMPKISLWKKLYFSLTFPFFSIIGDITLLSCVFRKVTWQPIPHDASIRIEEIEDRLEEKEPVGIK